MIMIKYGDGEEEQDWMKRCVQHSTFCTLAIMIYAASNCEGQSTRRKEVKDEAGDVNSRRDEVPADSDEETVTRRQW